MDEALRQATLGATNIQTPTSPLGSFPELSQLYQSSFQLPQSSGAAGALANSASKTVQEQQAAASAQKDKSKYQRVKKADGGYAFYDPTGKEISAAEYAYALGGKPADVLSDSENPIDIGYQSDYRNLQDYIEAKLNSKSNKTLAAKAKNIEDQVREAHGIDLARMNPNQLIESFKAAYPTVYGRQNTGVPVGQSFIPQFDNNALDLTGGSDSIGG